MDLSDALHLYCQADQQAGDLYHLSTLLQGQTAINPPTRPHVYTLTRFRYVHGLSSQHDLVAALDGHRHPVTNTSHWNNLIVAAANKASTLSRDTIKSIPLFTIWAIPQDKKKNEEKKDKNGEENEKKNKEEIEEEVKEESDDQNDEESNEESDDRNEEIILHDPITSIQMPGCWAVTRPTHGSEQLASARKLFSLPLAPDDASILLPGTLFHTQLRHLVVIAQYIDSVAPAQVSHAPNNGMVISGFPGWHASIIIVLGIIAVQRLSTLSLQHYVDNPQHHRSADSQTCALSNPLRIECACLPDSATLRLAKRVQNGANVIVVQNSSLIQWADRIHCFFRTSFVPSLPHPYPEASMIRRVLYIDKSGHIRPYPGGDDVTLTPEQVSSSDNIILVAKGTLVSHYSNGNPKDGSLELPLFKLVASHFHIQDWVPGPYHSAILHWLSIVLTPNSPTFSITSSQPSVETMTWQEMSRWIEQLCPPFDKTLVKNVAAQLQHQPVRSESLAVAAPIMRPMVYMLQPGYQRLANDYDWDSDDEPEYRRRIPSEENPPPQPPQRPLHPSCSLVVRTMTIEPEYDATQRDAIASLKDSLKESINADILSSSHPDPVLHLLSTNPIARRLYMAEILPSILDLDPTITEILYDPDKRWKDMQSNFEDSRLAPGLCSIPETSLQCLVEYPAPVIAGPRLYSTVNNTRFYNSRHTLLLVPFEDLAALLVLWLHHNLPKRPNPNPTHVLWLSSRHPPSHRQSIIAQIRSQIDSNPSSSRQIIIVLVPPILHGHWYNLSFINRLVCFGLPHPSTALQGSLACIFGTVESGKKLKVIHVNPTSNMLGGLFNHK